MIGIVNYGMGNLLSVLSALEYIGADATICSHPKELHGVERIVLPGVGAALARLKHAGARLVVVTNQSGLGRGYFTSRDLEAIHSKLRLVLAEDGVTLDGLYFCPHHPDDHCNCRKPARGMIDRAHTELKVDLSRAYVIGDSVRDIELAKQVGAQSLLVMTGPSGAEALAALT